jgi:uncharacterized OB-fold protein
MAHTHTLKAQLQALDGLWAQLVPCRACGKAFVQYPVRECPRCRAQINREIEAWAQMQHLVSFLQGFAGGGA